VTTPGAPWTWLDGKRVPMIHTLSITRVTSKPHNQILAALRRAGDRDPRLRGHIIETCYEGRRGPPRPAYWLSPVAFRAVFDRLQNMPGQWDKAAWRTRLLDRLEAAEQARPEPQPPPEPPLPVPACFVSFHDLLADIWREVLAEEDAC
jgi:hypothetical protein